MSHLASPVTSCHELPADLEPVGEEQRESRAVGEEQWERSSGRAAVGKRRRGREEAAAITFQLTKWSILCSFRCKHDCFWYHKNLFTFLQRKRAVSNSVGLHLGLR